MEGRVKHVGIVGAGVSGLLACKYALSKGFTPIVFESQSSTGGVWTTTLKSTKLQTPKPNYQFSDFPWPNSVKEEYPSTFQALDYIESYARHFDLIRYIKFNTKVVSVSYEGHHTEEEMQSWGLWGGSSDPFGSNSKHQGRWKITVQSTKDPKSIEVYEVGFLILCPGRFSGVPSIPEFPRGKGPEEFRGKVVHSMEFSEMGYEASQAMIKGKRVVIVGGQKSAMDIAMECSSTNGVDHPTTMLYRTKRWNMPDYHPWGVPLAFLYQNRFSELLVHKPGEDFLLSLVATLLAPMRWGVSKFVESYIKWKLPLEKYGMVPKHSFLRDLSSCLTSSVPTDFYNRIEKGGIKLKEAQSFGFCKNGIVIEGEAKVLEADVVVLATGFNGIDKLKNIFVSPTFKKYMVGQPNTPLSLYRQCIHPRIPQMAIIGFSESITNLFTSEIRCKWLAELLDGTFKVPSIKQMEKDIAEWTEYMKQYDEKNYRRSCIGALHICYNDQLCKDMGWNPRRKKGIISELFEPYGPMDYSAP